MSNMVEKGDKRGSVYGQSSQRNRGHRPPYFSTSSSSAINLSPKGGKHRKDQDEDRESHNNIINITPNKSLPAMQFVNSTRHHSSKSSSSRASPSKERSPRRDRDRAISTSPCPTLGAGYFAGPKFSEPPSPASLPKPPTHWTHHRRLQSCAASAVDGDSCTRFSNHLKMLLNVSASA